MAYRFLRTVGFSIFFFLFITGLQWAQTSPPDMSGALPANSAISQSLSASFSWASVPGATAYIIQISKDDFANNVVDQSVSAATYTASGLEAGVAYKWRVYAIGASDTSAASATLSFTTKLTAPSLSSPTNAVVGQSITPTLTWLAVTNATSYDVYVDTDSTFASTTPTNVAAPTVTCTLDTLSNFTKYFWRVRAKGVNATLSDYSLKRNFTTIQATPSSVINPANGAVAFDSTKFTYRWNAIPAGSNSVKYEFQVSKSSNFTSADTKNYSSTTTYYASSDYLEAGKKYYWHIRAKVGSVTTAYSDTLSFTIGTPSASLGITNAAITMDHATGRISQLNYLKGSGQPLLSSTLNDNNKTGLGRVSGETGTKLASWSETNPQDSAGTCTYNYENTLYGSKSLLISWDYKGVVVDINLSLNANKSAVLNAAWQPGGDIGPIHDYVLYAKDASTIKKVNMIYPGSAATSVLSTGDSTTLVAMNDNRTDEYFGFISSSKIPTVVQQGTAILGPQFTYAASTSPQSKTIRFAVKNRSNFFASNKYFLVTSPAAGDKIADLSKPTVRWESYGVPSSAFVDVLLSTDGGSTFGTTLSSNKPNTESNTVTNSVNLSGGSSNNNCMIKIRERGASTAGVSGIFSITRNVATVFSIPRDLTGAPTTTVSIPIKVTPGTGASINAFEVRVTYDKNNLTYSGSTFPGSLKDWVVSANASKTDNFIAVGGYNSTGSAISTVDTMVILKFSIKSTATIGQNTSLSIDNSYLAAADASANSLEVAGVNGMLTYYSRVSGYIRYITNKKGIKGSNFIQFNDADNLSNTTNLQTNSAGFYDFSDRIPGSVLTITPDNTKPVPNPITPAVSSVDARKAFEGRDGGTATLTELQKIAADVNSDGMVNAIDAYAILKISTSDPSAFGSNWIFVDSTFTLTSSNWPTAPQSVTLSPFNAVKSKQSFWAMIRGDVDGSYDIGSDSLYPSVSFPGSKGNGVLLSKSTFDANSLTFRVPRDLRAQSGDTLYIPLNVALNGKAIGAFNASIQIDSKILKYTGLYSMGSSIPADKGWVMSAYYDTTSRRLNIGATDFAGAIDPIIKDGSVGVFKFIVNSSAETGDTSQIKLSGFSVADANLLPLVINFENGKMTVAKTSSVDKGNTEITTYNLLQNYPNPFNPVTTIEYALPKDSRVTIEIYNSIGQKVTELFNGSQVKGYHKLEWNAANFTSGVYFYSIKAVSLSDKSDFSRVRKMILMK